MPIGNHQCSIAEQIVLAVEKPIPSYGGVGNGIRESTHDLFAHHVRQARINDASRLSCVESADHVSGDRRIACLRPLRPSNPDAKAVAERRRELARPPVRFLERQLSYALQTPWHHAGLSG